ncbi:MAG: aminomethyl-transferring glycine dehydrogenase, partial [Betaproteobacteria bacterium]|nr:aminomethyl-transferring glycine dehydrogenase [Betaproteobacteria bacterium]
MSMIDPTLDELIDRTEFVSRHLGPSDADEHAMLQALGLGTTAELIDQVVPAPIRMQRDLDLPPPIGEAAAIAELRRIAGQNQVWRSYIGMGYADTVLPAVIRRNVLENPGWYTAYTPYQAEISQGRLEALLAFQQMLIDLAGLPVANASLLDEATAAGEAMTMIRRAAKSKSAAFFVDAACHPQVDAVIRTRARWLGIPIVSGDPARDLDPAQVFGAHLQYPDTYGVVRDWSAEIEQVHAARGLVSLGVDPLALVLIKSPGTLGADIAVGSAQRFGVPMGYGGPHAGFMAARAELVRQMPGRIIGVAKDVAGNVAYRMALQTREQHIRREKATSNICTSQVLLANIAAFYAIYHGPDGLRRIALRTHFMARLLALSVNMSLEPESTAYFDTVTFGVGSTQSNARKLAETKRINLRWIGTDRVGVTLDETTTIEDVENVAWALTGHHANVHERAQALATGPEAIPAALRRSDAILSHPVFNRYRSETEMMRYLKRLENRDYSLAHGMIPLGSCTMKLNAAAEMAPVSWPEFASIHPFAPREQARGYTTLLGQMSLALAEITGLPRMSFQPNSGANGEYTGLVAIRNYQASRGEGARDVCLIPSSAHGTNPASAIMAGMRVVVVKCDAHGNVDIADLKDKLTQHRERLSAIMITYPSTHGVFEPGVKEICSLVHDAGGQVYMDGANLNALAGIARPGDFGADVCHINLHKTFCIPHGGGGPGMGPIGVAAHLAPHLPCHPVVPEAGLDAGNGTVGSAPFGSPLIVTISWMYVRMMGARGIRRASEVAILNANYVAKRLADRFPILYTGAGGRVAHECILDTRGFKDTYGVTAEDIAKRLMDYGFHAPTLSFPVPDTLMVEPTESESLAELDRFCDAMIAIHGELERIQRN